MPPCFLFFFFCSICYSLQFTYFFAPTLFPFSRPHHIHLTSTLFWCISERYQRKKKNIPSFLNLRSINFTTRQRYLPRCSLLLPLPFCLSSHVRECFFCSYPTYHIYTILTPCITVPTYFVPMRDSPFIPPAHANLSSDWLKPLSVLCPIHL